MKLKRNEENEENEERGEGLVENERTKRRSERGQQLLAGLGKAHTWCSLHTRLTAHSQQQACPVCSRGTAYADVSKERNFGGVRR